MTNTAPQTDTELIDATIEAVTSTMPIGLDADQAAAAAQQFDRTAARQPGALLRRGFNLATEQARITAGTSTIEPDGRDRRFADEAWTKNPFYRRLGQTYLSWNKQVHGLVDDLELDDKSKLRSDFLVNLVTEAARPDQHPARQPGSAERSGQTRRARASSTAPATPFTTPAKTAACPRWSTADPSPLAKRSPPPQAPSSSRTRYWNSSSTPDHDQGPARPIFIVPPQINKYYILDLAPGRSLIEHLVGSGQQVFSISWRNAQPEHRDWDLDTYVAAVLEATDAALEITGSPDLNVLGVCAGGITSAAMLGHLAAIGDKRVNAATFLVTIIDWDVPSTMGTMISAPVVAASTRRSQDKGILAGEDLNKIFAWLRPNDLVWNYWVNNYLMGKNPPAFDVLAWNGDSTNLPAGLHADFMTMAADNAMVKPGAVEVLETPIDLGQIDCPSVRRRRGHRPHHPVAGLLRNDEASRRQHGVRPQLTGSHPGTGEPVGQPQGQVPDQQAIADTPDAWLEGATEHAGSWWDHWTKWLKTRSGKLVAASTELGSDLNPAGVAAPGSYVFE